MKKMNIPNKLNIGTRFSIVLLTLLMTATLVSAQRGSTTKTIEAQPPNLDQCANGALPAAPVTCTGSAWVNGNLNENNSQWVEGQFVPYRVSIVSMTIGETSSISIEWDTTEGTKHAIDYIGTYNASNPADPCSGFTCGASSTFPIPLDPRVAAAGVTQIGGQVFTIWGGTITSLSPYFYSGPADYSDTTKAGITINFTSNVNGTVVIAWGGHIATRQDWGIANSAVSLPGSPYHMRILGTGNQDRSMSVQGIVFPAIVTIIKVANPYTGTGASDQLFRFTASSNFGTTEFFLQDNNNNADGNADSITQNVTDFTNAITVTEDTNIGGGWSLANLQCVDSDGGLGFSSNSSPQPPGTTGPTATILAQEGELITCTFTNNQQQPTAAPVSLSGRVMNAFGRGISGVTLTLTDLETGNYRVVNTNTFGYYTFSDLPAGQFYELKIRSKRYSFPEPTRYFTLNEDAFDVNFVANP